MVHTTPDSIEIPEARPAVLRRSAGDPCSLASRRLSPLLALEITLSGRAAADQRGAARLDPADEQ